MNSQEKPLEQGIPLKEVPNYLPRRNSKKIHKSTVFRWATKGVRGRMLETHLVGGIRYTTVKSIMKFLGASCDETVEKQQLRHLMALKKRIQSRSN